MERWSKIYEFAGLRVRIKYAHEEVGKYFRKYESNGKAQFRIRAKEQDIAVERKAAEAEGERFSEWCLEKLAIHRLFSIAAAKYGVLLFHGSALMVDGKAYIFAAPSGTGKSTHARLWREMLGDRVTMINDDKPFLRFQDGVWWVYGSPWNGKHHLDNNIKVLLKAICFLEQSATNEIERLSNRESYARLCQQVYFPSRKRECEAVVHSVGRLFELPMYLLKCNISEEAARLSYHTMRGGDIE